MCLAQQLNLPLATRCTRGAERRTLVRRRAARAEVAAAPAAAASVEPLLGIMRLPLAEELELRQAFGVDRVAARPHGLHLLELLPKQAGQDAEQGSAEKVEDARE